MRQRIRTFKPELFKHERLWDLQQQVPELPLFQTFLGLISAADREGRFEWRPRALKSDIAPYWDGHFEKVLRTLERGGFIVSYTVGGREYGWVPGFTKHQRIDHHEPKSELPAPPDDLACPGGAEASLENAPREWKGMEGEWEREGSGKGISRAHASDPPSGVRPKPERVFSLPTDDPPQEYLDDAVMAGVPRAQAVSTWEHYRGAGLPERGVERLHSWLVKRAQERWLSQQRTGGSGFRDARATIFDREEERIRQLRLLETSEAQRQGLAP